MLENIKKWSMVLGTVMLLVSCSKDMEDVNPSSTLSGVSTDAAKAANLTSPIAVSPLTTTDGKTWSFTIQRTAADGNVPNIGSVLITLTGCDDTQIALSSANVVSASVSGVNTQTLVPTYKEGNGSACDMTAVAGYLRLTDFSEKLTDGKFYTITFTLREAIRVKSANIWTRISNSCYLATVAGPGCQLDLCGEGQGYFHKSEHWNGIATVTIGGHNYTAAEAVTLITSDKKEGGSDNGGKPGKKTEDEVNGIADSKAAFAQGVTVLLNRQLGWISSNAYAAELAAIEAYLKDLKKLTDYDIENLPTGNAAAKAAAGYIGDHIDCEDAESAE